MAGTAQLLRAEGVYLPSAAFPVCRSPVSAGPTCVSPLVRWRFSLCAGSPLPRAQAALKVPSSPPGVFMKALQWLHPVDTGYPLSPFCPLLYQLSKAYSKLRRPRYGFSA